MKVIVIGVLSWLALVATVAAQGAPSGKAASPNAAQGSGAASPAQLSEIRSLAHQLQAHTEKLDDLMTQYSSLVGQRPQAQGGSADAKRAHDEQLARWDTALERLLRRIDGARAAVAESMQHLERLATGKLPTGLAKDVARARNEAVAQRTAAEQVLVKNKATLARASKPTKQSPATESTSSLPDDL
jgi:uncharacterized protein YukE